MTSENKDNIAPEAEIEDRVLLKWTTHPMKRRPLVAVLVTVFIFIIAGLAFSMTESKAFAVLALVVLFMSLAKFYLPTRYMLTEKFVVIKTTTQKIEKKWSEYRSFYPDKNGVLLSPFVDPSRLENFRGIYLIFEKNKDEVVKIVEKMIAQAQAEKKATN